MNYVLFDHPDTFQDLLPLTYTRPISDLRVGILTIKEKWEYTFEIGCSILTEEYLQEKYPLECSYDNLFIDSSSLPDTFLVDHLTKLEDNTSLWANDRLIAFRGSDLRKADSSKKIIIDENFDRIKFPWDIFSKNGKEIDRDFEWVTKDRKSESIAEGNFLRNEAAIFVEAGAEVDHAFINAEDGPVYIGKGAKIMAGSIINGPLALCEYSTIKLGAKIYGPTTIGPWCKVGGELNNVVFHSYSSKAHDGFLGNAVIGQWCNIGADSNNSNLKNTYDKVKMWNYSNERFINSGLQFCGLIMADHSKCGINTMFNTGTVIGVNTNIFGTGFPRNFIPSFAWGGNHGFSEYNFKKACSVAKQVMARRDRSFDEVEEAIMEKVFESSSKYRSSFKS